MNAPINIPANPYVTGFIASQMQSNIAIGENVPDVMFLDDKGKPIPNGKITKVLQNIGEVDGILFDNETGKGINRLTSAYDLRRIFATAAFFKNYSLVEAGRAGAVLSKSKQAHRQFTHLWLRVYIHRSSSSPSWALVRTTGNSLAKLWD